MLTFLAGGVGAARLLAGVVEVVERSRVTAVVNTGDDLVLHGLHISPDLDTVTYTLAGLDNQVTGWGVADETWTTAAELEVLGGETWFKLGDRDLATHLFRTQRLSEGATLGVVTAELAARRGIGVRLLPMSDDPVRTRLALAGESSTEVAFQHYFVRLAHAVPVRAVRFEGADAAVPGPGVLAALESAETVVVCPSNPVVSIGPILAVPGIEAALRARRESVVAVSPIVAGAALKGPADRLLRELGHESSVVGVARLYAPWVGTLVIDQADADLAPAVEREGVRCVVAATVMADRAQAARLARHLLDLGA
ncbi:MAG TPA: 2-phospho-L-lactate transferase [Acidimicrobiales bacterium]|jgi:LPPG:FO 2-phospho-L-lactate transferase